MSLRNGSNPPLSSRESSRLYEVLRVSNAPSTDVKWTKKWTNKSECEKELTNIKEELKEMKKKLQREVTELNVKLEEAKWNHSPPMSYAGMPGWLKDADLQLNGVESIVAAMENMTAS